MKKKENKQHQTTFSFQSVKIAFVLINVADSNLIFTFLSCREKAHDNKDFSCENSTPHRESRITTRYVEPCSITFSWDLH